MGDRRNIVQITPFIGVTDMDRAIDFYTNILGFSVWRNGDYAYLELDRAGLRLLVPDAAARARYNPILVYIDVHDVAAMYAQLTPALAGLPVERVKGPYDQPYGMRELIITDPDGNIITFGQGVGDNAGQWDYRA